MHFLLRPKWVIDDDGAITLSFFGGVITFTKYKHSVIIEWFKFHYEAAPKYIK
jgi:hypothetical protein